MTLRARVPSFQLFLIGLWQSAWKAPPSEIYELNKVDVPVGIGVVIPAMRITEVLELPILIEKRRTKKAIHIEYAASPDVAPSPINTENPQHKEDFNSFVSAAVKKKPRDD